MGDLKDDFYKSMVVVKRLFACYGIPIFTRNHHDSPCERILRNVHYSISCTIVLTTIATLIWYVFEAETLNLIDITNALPCICYCIIGFVKMQAIRLKLTKVENLLNDLERLFPSKETDEVIVRIVKKQMTWVKMALTIVIVITFTFIITWDISALLLMIISYVRTGTYERLIPYHIYLPFEPVSFPLYVLRYLSNCFLATYTTIGTVAPDIFFVVVASHIVMQFQLLKIKMNENIENSLPIELHSTLDINHNHHDVMYKKMIEYVHIHRELIAAADVVEDIFTFTTLVQFLASTILICCVGFQSTVMGGMDAVIFGLFLATGLSMTFFLCSVGEQMIEESTAIGTSIYNSSWYVTDKKYRQMIFIIILRSQRAQVFTALRFSVVCLRSFCSIISTSYSYFTLLNTSYKK